MKKSQQLKIEADKEENDLAYLGKMNKVFREQRFEKFEEKWLPKLKEITTVVEDNNKYTFDTPQYGTLDYFPKANKILIRKSNKWVSRGLKFIIKNILKI